MSAGPRRLTEPQLEFYLVGSLDAEAQAQVEAVLAESEVDRARLEELMAKSAAFLIQNPPEPLVERFEAAHRPWWHHPLVVFAPVLAASAYIPQVEMLISRNFDSHVRGARASEK